MKIIRIINSSGSFCSSEVKDIIKEIENKLQQAIRLNSDKKFVIEIFDLENIEKLNPVDEKISKRRYKFLKAI